ncbi:hypothetical protein [Rhodopirellula halodulae]|uniref:hypothetical protein n=1 Tax=Rhodopirellula halodulae TaxID=2894198 RepID=UPI001E313812|nr:hypothetical protein [Rhodopirellula sp. JC737]MCC9654258.1 hypothetical protein [Rhodopirellula sp. JC737]
MSNWSAATFRYVLVGYVSIPLGINVAINALIGWLLFLDRDSLPVWGLPQSVAMEIAGTGFLLPLITAMISSRVLLGHLRSGIVQPIHQTAASSRIASRLVDWVGRVLVGQLLQNASFAGCVLFALTMFPLLTIPAFLALPTLGVDSVDQLTLIAIKCVYAGLCGFVTTPLIAVGLLCHAGQAHSRQSTEQDPRESPSVST